MTNTALILTLERKQKELEEERTSYQKKIKTLTSQLTSLSETMAIFKVCPKQVRYFKNNERQKMILELLKKHNRPMSSSELSEKVQEIKKIELITKKDRLLFSRKFSDTLKNMKNKNLIEEVGSIQRANVWQIKPKEI